MSAMKLLKEIKAENQKQAIRIATLESLISQIGNYGEEPFFTEGNFIHSEPKLLDTPKKKPARKAPYLAIPLWCDAWKSRYYSAFAVSGQDSKQLTELANMFPQDQLTAMIADYVGATYKTPYASVFDFYKQRNIYAARHIPQAQKVADPDALLAELESQK